MPRWFWFAPLTALVLALAVWAFRLGWIAATVTETDVIEKWTLHYLETKSPTARASDCTGQPGTAPGVWILVSCVNGLGERHDFPVNRFGRLVEVTPEPSRPTAPET